ncbi:interferon-inducible GTPase-domain-containing protein [Desarmillaria ectypa]|nr:interferon-inducible GTPase-domain-containing protein [Desarmillaria ectypa]
MKKILEAQKEIEAKWKKGIHPVEWPSREQYEANKRRFYKEGKFHIAITGASGSGKSSLVNAVRGIWDDDEGAAPTDVVETTLVVTPHPDPDPTNPFIWFDVPGSGTISCPDWTYFNDQGLYIFDAIIILFNDCFTAADVAILQNCARYMIPAYLVRSKSDVHIANLISKKQRSAGPKADLVKISLEARKEYIVTSQKTVNVHLAKNDPPLPLQKVYAVSRDTLTYVVRRDSESLGSCTVLNEHELLRDLQGEAKQKDEEMKNIHAAKEEMEARWKKGIRPVEWPSQEQYEKVKQQYYKEGKFHLAIAGISGTGKSTLINAFRGIWDGEEKAAPTDVVESTSIVTAYPDPNPSNPFIWFDVPGSGTLSCSDWTYFNNQGLFIFDAIIVLFNDRFTATDAAILKNAERYNIPTYIVRSKSDIHIENIVKKTRRVPGARRDPAKVLDDARKEYMTKTRDSVRANLMKNDPPLRSQKMYVVSRDALTLTIREEPLEDNLLLDEYELWKDILQDAFSRRSEKSYGSMAELMKKAGSGILGLFA